MLPLREINRLLSARKIVRREGPPVFYEEVAKIAEPDLDSVPDEEPQTYATRDMLAEPKRRRGRPPGSRNRSNANE